MFKADNLAHMTLMMAPGVLRGPSTVCQSELVRNAHTLVMSCGSLDCLTEVFSKPDDKRWSKAEDNMSLKLPPNVEAWTDFKMVRVVVGSMTWIEVILDANAFTRLSLLAGCKLCASNPEMSMSSVNMSLTVATMRRTTVP